RIVGTGYGTFGAGAQFLLEAPDFRIRAGLRFQYDVASRIVVDLAQRLVDVRDALLDGFALAGQLGIEVGNFVDRVDVEQFLESRNEAWQVVAAQLRQQVFVFKGRLEAGIHLDRLELERFLE